MTQRYKRSEQLNSVRPRQSRILIGDFNRPNTLQAQTRPVQRSFSGAPIARNNSIEDVAGALDMNDTGYNAKPGQNTIPKRRGSKRFRNRSRPFTFKRFFKKASAVMAFAVVAIGIFFGAKLFMATQNILDGNDGSALALQDNVDPSQLQGEGDGRVNILLIGIGGDNHMAGDLADVIMVASIDPLDNEVAMLSLPRDMYVDIPGYGQDRINAAHAYGEQYGHDNGGVGLLQETVEQTLDIPIHYYMRIDFEAFIQAVDTVGGIDLFVEEDLYDSNFAWQYGILNVSAGHQHFDGATALMYARSRYTSAGGDFDRNARQRAMIVALKNKVLNLGTFSNPIKIAQLIDSAGSHVRTNLEIGEMLRLYEISEQIPEDKVISVGLDSSEEGYLRGDNIGGASVLLPRSGDYQEIQRFVRSIFIDGYIRSENAAVEVLNGTGIEGAASEAADELRSYGYNVHVVDNAAMSTYTNIRLYDLSDGSKPYTKRYLERRFGQLAQPPEALSSQEVPNEYTSFLIIIGSNTN